MNWTIGINTFENVKYGLHGRLQLDCAVLLRYFNFRHLCNHWHFRNLWKECQIIWENFHSNKNLFFIWHSFVTKVKQSRDATSIEKFLLKQRSMTAQSSWSSPCKRSLKAHSDRLDPHYWARLFCMCKAALKAIHKWRHANLTKNWLHPLPLHLT